jgi:hypothetical protein
VSALAALPGFAAPAAAAGFAGFPERFFRDEELQGPLGPRADRRYGAGRADNDNTEASFRSEREERLRAGQGQARPTYRIDDGVEALSEPGKSGHAGWNGATGALADGIDPKGHRTSCGALLTGHEADGVDLPQRIKPAQWCPRCGGIRAMCPCTSYDLVVQGNDVAELQQQITAAGEVAIRC